MGTSEFSVPSLKRLIASESEVVAVYTQPDKRAGRGRVSVLSPVKLLAQSEGIPVFQPASLRDSGEIEHLRNLKADVVIVVAFGQILSQDVLDIPEYGCLNIHPSLLPKYRGPSPIVHAILAGDKKTGASIMLLNAGTDTGPVIAQNEVSVGPEDTAETLENKLAETGAELLLKTLPAWFERKLVPSHQDNDRATYTRQISKEDGLLDWQLTAPELERRVRAFSPWPGCYTRWQGKKLKVLDAVSLTCDEEMEPGRVVSLADKYEIPAGVSTAAGVLGLGRIQLEGKKAMLIKDFLRGQREFIGQKLG